MGFINHLCMQQPYKQENHITHSAMGNYFARFFCAVVLAASLSGCMESSFTLAPESRLPKWLHIPEGVPREEVTVTMDYYVYPGERTATFTLHQGKSSWGSTNKITGVVRGSQPLQLKNPPPGFPKGYPSYEVITVDGITDIIEHRRMEPLFYVTDDPGIWEELGVPRENLLPR